jgi:hypothetical protein
MLQVTPFLSSRLKYSLCNTFPSSSVKSFIYASICPSKASDTMLCGTSELTEMGTSASRDGPATTRRRGIGGGDEVVCTREMDWSGTIRERGYKVVERHTRWARLQRTTVARDRSRLVQQSSAGRYSRAAREEEEVREQGAVSTRVQAHVWMLSAHGAHLRILQREREPCITSASG